MDVLEEGGAGQLRDPLTVKLVPEATRPKRRKIVSELAHLAVHPPPPHCPQRYATLFLHCALPRQ